MAIHFKEIKTIIEGLILRDEKMGEQAAGSGHLAYKDFSINDIQILCQEAGGPTRVIYDYTLSTVSEFTVYPDNPPFEERFRKEILLNSAGEIISESKKEYLDAGNSPIFDGWEMVKGEILNLVELFLLKIEWRYGDNRAPLFYPPEFNILTDPSGSVRYQCFITRDGNGDDPLIIETENMGDLPDYVRKFLGEDISTKINRGDPDHE